MSARFTEFEVESFAPHIFVSHWTKVYSVGCGATALSLITGVSPLTIGYNKKTEQFLKNWRDPFMLAFLKKRGYKTLDITGEKVIKATLGSPVTSRHVVLISQRYTAKESSWAVVFNNLYFHNFEVLPLKALEFVNYPLLTAYLVKKA